MDVDVLYYLLLWNDIIFTYKYMHKNIWNKIVLLCLSKPCNVKLFGYLLLLFGNLLFFALLFCDQI